MKAIKLFVSLSIFAPLSVLACENTIFVCESDSAKSLSLAVCELNGSFYLERFDFENKRQLESATSIELVKSSYHRSLVNEHSASFSINELDVVLSDYRSEELGEIEAALNVIVAQAQQAQTFACEGASYSKLAEIEHSH